MSYESATDPLGRGDTGLLVPGHLGALTSFVPFELVDDILARHGVQRRAPRLLPARVGVYFLLAQALFAGVGALGIWQKLTRCVSLQHRRPSEKALRELFDVLAGPLAPTGATGVGYRGMRTVAFDGCASTKVPDNADTVSWLGKVLHRVGWAGYPVVMIVALVETGTRGLLGASLGTPLTGELAFASRLLRHLRAGMLLLLDRGFDANDFLTRTAATGAHFLVRLQSKRRLPIRAKLPDGSYLTEFGGLQVRVVEARTHAVLADGRIIGGTYRLATTLLDHRRDPAARLVGLYHERWEIESTAVGLTVRLHGTQAATGTTRWDDVSLRSSADGSCDTDLAAGATVLFVGDGVLGKPQGRSPRWAPCRTGEAWRGVGDGPASPLPTGQVVRGAQRLPALVIPHTRIGHERLRRYITERTYRRSHTL